MVDETLVNELLQKLQELDDVEEAAKKDAKRHNDRKKSLLAEIQSLRHKIEGTGPTLFDEEGDDSEPEGEPQRMTALDDAPPSAEEAANDEDDAPPVPQGDLGDRAYEAGAQARREGRPESDCPHESDTFLGRSWINGWRELEDVDGLPEEGSTES